MTTFYTYKKDVKLKPGQVLGFLRGYGYYAKTKGAPAPKPAPKPTPPGLKAMELALTQLGVHESPAGSNDVKYAEWYGLNGEPWCAMFVTWCMVQTGSKHWSPGSFTASVDAISVAAANKTNGLSFTSDPQPGDLAVYGVDEHVEFFQKWVDRATGVFQAVGGNTTSGDGSYNDGGEVASKPRYVAGNDTQKPVRFVRVS